MNKFRNTDATMNKLIKANIPGNDIIIYKDGKEVYRSYRGYSDIENKISMNGKEKYNMYSCSKIVTAVAVLQLVEKGLLNLEDNLCEYIPEFETMYLQNGEKAKNKITIKHLLTMTAGFTYDTNSKAIQQAKKETNGRCPTLETMKYIAKEPLVFEPGTKWRYSLCHDILAAVIEAVTGLAFGEYVRQNIFIPLNMDNSTFLLPDNEIDSICSQYRMNNNGELENCGKEIQNNFKMGTEYESGGAGLISTVEDCIKFLEGLRANKILGRDMVEKMHTNQILNADDSDYWPKENGYSYGFGVRSSKNKDDNITDFGWGGLAGAYATIDTINNYTIFFAMHVINASELDGRKGILNAVRKDLRI